MTTSARPFPFLPPSFPQASVRSFRLSAQVSLRFLFLPLHDLRFRFLRFRFRILSFLFFLSALRQFRLPVAFPTPRSHLSVPSDFPLPNRLVSHPVFRFRLFGSPVCSLSLFPASLPQPFHRCSAFPGPFFTLAVRPCVRSLSVSCLGFPQRTRFRFLLLLSFALPVRFFRRASLRSSTALRFCFRPAFAVLPLRSRPFRISATQSPFLPFPSSAFRLTVASSLPAALRVYLSAPFFALVFRLRFLPSGPLFPSVQIRFRLCPSASLSRGSSPARSAPFGSVLSGRLRLRYSVPLLFLSPLCGSPHSGCPHRLPSLSGSGLPLRFLLPGTPVRFFPSLPSVRFSVRLPLRSSPAVPALPLFLHSTSLPLWCFVRIRFGLLGILIHPEN